MTHTFELFSQAFILAAVVVASLLTIAEKVDSLGWSEQVRDRVDVWRIRRANRKKGRGK